MNVEEALSAVHQVSSESVLVAIPPITWGADAKFVLLTSDYRVPQEHLDAGYQYLLGIEDIEMLLEAASEKKMSSRTLAEFVIHYATFDSYPSWFNDIPDKT
jgi:hypothetical protein